MSEIKTIVPKSSFRRIAQGGGFNAAKYNATIEEMIQEIQELQQNWNTIIVPGLSAVPQGLNDDEFPSIGDSIDAILNGFSGDQIWTDNTADADSDEVFYDNDRKLTVKESILKLSDKIDDNFITVQGLLNTATSASNEVGTDEDAVHVNENGEIRGLVFKTVPVDDDIFIIEDSEQSFSKKKLRISDLPGAGGGEANTATNVNTGGVGVFRNKAGVDLKFRGINTASPKVTVTLDSVNNEIDIDVVDASTIQAGAAEIATQGEVNAGTDTVRYITPATLAIATTVIKTSQAAGGDLAGTYPNPTVVAASTTVAGKIELATQGEVNTGTDVLRAVTPATLASATTVLHASDIGTTAQAWDADLDAVAALAATGIAVRSASNTWVQRTIVPTTSSVVIGNGDGVAGNPSIDVAVSTEVLAGKIEIATQAETNTGTDNVRAITPAKLANATNVVHSNIANEISGLTEKTALVSGDLLLIEDSEAGYVKKKVQITSLLDSQVLAKTTAYVVLTTDQGSLFTNEGAAAEIDFTLPSAATSLGPYHFYNQDANGLRVIADTGDTIRIGVGGSAVTAAAGNIKPQNQTDIGAFVTLVAINASEWIAMSLNGSWTAT